MAPPAKPYRRHYFLLVFERPWSIDTAENVGESESGEAEVIAMPPERFIH